MQVIFVMNHLFMKKVYGKKKKIWSLNSLNKVKHFIWRACENSLPTKCNLVRHKVISNHTCDHCLGPLEIPIHAIWAVPSFDCVWGRWLHGTFELTFLSRILANCWIIKNDKNLELFSMLTWSIWTQRNQIRTQQMHCSTDQLAQFPKDRFDEYMAIQLVVLPRILV